MSELTANLFLSLFSILPGMVGIILVGTVSNSIIFASTRQTLYLSVMILGINGILFIVSELLVLALGAMNHGELGVLAHRFEALSAALFLATLPFFIYHLLELKPFTRNLVTFFVGAGIVLFLFFTVMAFVLPKSFLELRHADSLVTVWNRGRGIPGPLYQLRDLCIFIWSIFLVVLLTRDLRKHKPSPPIILTFIGVIIAIISGLTDLVLAAKESPQGLFSIRMVSFFGLGLTLFITLSMVAVLHRLISQLQDSERSRKIESLGLMAGGIAHDFNNLLAGILGNATLAKEYLKADSDSFPLMGEIISAVGRAKLLSQQLLTFSRGGLPVRESIDLATLIRETTVFLLRGTAINPRFKLPPDLWLANVDSGQFTQVIQNLVLNARQSMTSGNIDIQASNTTLSFTVNDLSAGAYVAVEIRDYGDGIAPQNLSLVFDPYFSTKTEGSGLGLAIVHSIIQKHGGQITVSLPPDGGTQFRFLIPALPGSAVQRLVKTNVEERPLSGRILIMDDEELLGTMIARLLKKMGLETMITRDSDHAVSYWSQAKAEGRPFIAGILDLTIPGGKGGVETAREILALDPAALLFASSGYSEICASHPGEYGFIAILPKPYSFYELREILYQFLPK